MTLLQDLRDREYEFRGQADVDDIVKDAWNYLPECDESNIEKSATYHTNAFKQKWGFTTHRQKKPERMLEKDDPKTVAYQDWINTASAKRGVHEHLIGYWDQVWTLMYTPEEQLVYKAENKSGTEQDSFVHLFTKLCTINKFPSMNTCRSIVFGRLGCRLII